jgi:predicted lipoprotein with Yx(FWY)xxD motif
MHPIRPIIVVLCQVAAALALPGVARAQAKVAGGVLTDDAGLTLYVFDNDATVPGGSACIGSCLNMWTPLYAPAGAKATGDYSLVQRDDGKQQWAYKGKPLYRWYNDKKPGDQDGDGLRRTWHVARP